MSRIPRQAKRDEIEPSVINVLEAAGMSVMRHSATGEPAALRKAAIDYSFTKPTGPKWERAKPAMKAIVVRYRAPQPKP